MQIIDEIKKSIVRGELKPGSQIPSQREFAITAKVNPNTVQRAYREMERMELVETLRGQGTFICNREGLVDEIRSEMAESTISGFLNEMRALGFRDKEMLDLIGKYIKREE